MTIVDFQFQCKCQIFQEFLETRIDRTCAHTSMYSTDFNIYKDNINISDMLILEVHVDHDSDDIDHI